MRKYLFLFIAAIAAISCAPTEPATPVISVAITNEVFRAQKEAEQALNIARSDSAQISNLKWKLESVSEQINAMDSSFSSISFVMLRENQIQLALLREEVAILRKSLEKQDSILLLRVLRGPVPTAPDLPPDSISIEYDIAKELLLKKDYPKAAELFEGTAEKYSNSGYKNVTSDSWYWAGESRFAMGNYAQAISAYERVFLNPNSQKTADAQFQIGMCLIRMGNGEAAKPFFRKVIEFYPKHPRAAQAQAALNRLR